MIGRVTMLAYSGQRPEGRELTGSVAVWLGWLWLAEFEINNAKHGAFDRQSAHGCKTPLIPTTEFARAGFNRPARVLPGDDIGKETPVPIPNTVVKLSEPMIVQQTRK